MFRKKHKVTSAIDLNSHRKKYLRIIIVFLMTIAVVFFYAISKPQNLSKYKTTTVSQMGNLNVETDQVSYDSMKKELRIGMLVTNQSDDQNSKKNNDSNFSDMMNNLNNDSEILETMSNLKFKAEVEGINNPNLKLPVKVCVINSNYIVVTVNKLIDTEPLIRMTLTPKIINKNSGNSLSNVDPVRSYYLRKDFKQRTLDDSDYSFKMDASASQIKSIKKVIKQGQKENKLLSKDINDKNKLIKDIQTEEKFDSKSRLENHQSQIQSYQSGIKEDNSKISSNNQQIESLKNQIKHINAS